jgi:hypothetical protein
MRQLTDTTNKMPDGSTLFPTVFTNNTTPTTKATNDVHKTTCWTAISAREVDLFVSTSSFCFRKALPSDAKADIVLQPTSNVDDYVQAEPWIDCYEPTEFKDQPRMWNSLAAATPLVNIGYRSTVIFAIKLDGKLSVDDGQLPGASKAYIGPFYPACAFRPSDCSPCFAFRVNISDEYRAKWSVDDRAGHDLIVVKRALSQSKMNASQRTTPATRVRHHCAND